MSWAPVYKFVKLIPRGRVITYGGLAKALSLRGGARSAGRAMAASPSGKGIPWHRVVGSGGKLLIREPYASLQRKLLESEGVEMTERAASDNEIVPTVPVDIDPRYARTHLAQPPHERWLKRKIVEEFLTMRMLEQMRCIRE